jgi:hypothetical protein
MNTLQPHLTFPDYKSFENMLAGASLSTKSFINPLSFFIPSEERVPSLDKKAFLKSLFSTRKVDVPAFKILDPAVERFGRFEDFTNTDEVNHIALWLLGAFSYLSKSDLRLGKELEVYQEGNPRNGRLDDVVIRDATTIVVETKKNLRYLLGENRLEFQIRDYKTECLRLMRKYLQSEELTVLLGIGGEETDVFPPGHPDCTTGQVGNVASTFYEKILSNNIKFITANAVWSLVAYQFISARPLDLFGLLRKTFSRQDVYGLLSGGIVVAKGQGAFSVEQLDLEGLA